MHDQPQSRHPLPGVINKIWWHGNLNIPVSDLEWNFLIYFTTILIKYACKHWVIWVRIGNNNYTFNRTKIIGKIFKIIFFIPSGLHLQFKSLNHWVLVPFLFCIFRTGADTESPSGTLVFGLGLTSWHPLVAITYVVAPAYLIP